MKNPLLQTVFPSKPAKQYYRYRKPFQTKRDNTSKKETRKIQENIYRQFFSRFLSISTTDQRTRSQPSNENGVDTNFVNQDGHSVTQRDRFAESFAFRHGWLRFPSPVRPLARFNSNLIDVVVPLLTREKHPIEMTKGGKKREKREERSTCSLVAASQDESLLSVSLSFYTSPCYSACSCS